MIITQYKENSERFEGDNILLKVLGEKLNFGLEIKPDWWFYSSEGIKQVGIGQLKGFLAFIDNCFPT